MGNPLDDIERNKMRSLSALVKASVNRPIKEIRIPAEVSKGYFYSLLGDEYVSYASTLSDTEARKVCFRSAEMCYELALENIEDYSVCEFSKENIRLRLEYLAKNSHLL